MAVSGNRHRIIGQHSDDPLVVSGSKGELVVLDYLGIDEARGWHQKLMDQREPHFWQVNDGGATGWNSVTGYFIADDAPRAVASA